MPCDETAGCLASAPASARRQVQFIQPKGLFQAVEPGTYAVVVLDNETAGVLAMVGGSDYAREPFNLATNGLRQSGSSFKPFTLMTAVDEGISPASTFSGSSPTYVDDPECMGDDGV